MLYQYTTYVTRKKLHPDKRAQIDKNTVRNGPIRAVKHSSQLFNMTLLHSSN